MSPDRTHLNKALDNKVLDNEALGGNDQKAPVTTVHVCGHPRPLLRRGLEQIFEGTGFVLSEVPIYGPPQASAIEHPSPALFIVDEKYCPLAIFELITDVKELNSEARVILLADQLDAGAVLAARNAGADGICLTSSSPEVLLHSMQLVMLGEVVVSSELILAALAAPVSEAEAPPEVNLGIEPAFGPAPKQLLSNREAQVLSWLKEGAPNKVIARKLNVAEATIKVHVKAILKKIGVGNRAQAAIWAAHNMSLETAGP
ncbi:MAG: response regulator transcription factor [Microvirga sp.]